MNRSTVRRALPVASVSLSVFGAFMVAAVAAPFFLKSSFKMSSESASTTWTSIMAGMDVASAIGLVTGGLAIGSVLIWAAKQAIKKGGRKAFIA
ncbi:hypothetical protein [Streptomyces sp. SP18CS02]|uniref:hypothetical protein n=1 Tax=Streptomyces sp. SP18CS02 TaxID=3002531 RepID=UPI002E7A8347|nr:hypothetical protein [Streptomyces sp. SP18CS02]MEE1752706.1 hypothetical protein [Streptomyces sp. SP18CS02]